MSTDWYTKLVLTIVAVCLALLVYQGHRETESGASGAEEGRYHLTPMPMARMVLRFDSQTGRTWKSLFPDLNAWEPVADSAAERLGEAIRESSGAPAAAAPQPAAPPLDATLPATPASPAPPSEGAGTPEDPARP